MKRNPSGIAPHHLEDHHTVMRLRGRMKTVQRLGCDVQSRCEAKRQFRTCQIVINSLGHRQNWKAATVELCRNAECSFAAYNDQTFKAQSFHIRDRLVVNVIDVSCAIRKSSVIASPKQGAAARQQSSNFRVGKFTCAGVAKQAFEAVFDSNDVHRMFANGGFYNSANYSVQTWSISASGHDSNSFVHCIAGFQHKLTLSVRENKQHLCGKLWGMNVVDELFVDRLSSVA